MTIRVRQNIHITSYEQSFLPEVVRGMIVGMRHFFVNLFGKKSTRPLQTIQYPEEKRIYPERYRGQHRLVPREDGSPRCVACYMCATACPAFCIHIVAAESEDTSVEKYPAAFEIDMLRCIYCGFCVEACPEDAIRMDTGIHTPAFYNREDAVVGRTDLLALLGSEGTSEPYGAQDFRDGKLPSNKKAH